MTDEIVRNLLFACAGAFISLVSVFAKAVLDKLHLRWEDKYLSERTLASQSFEHQRTAFTKVLQALCKAQEAFKEECNNNNGFAPVERRTSEEIERIHYENLLFLDKNVNEAVSLCVSVVSEAHCDFEDPSDKPDAEVCRRSYEYLTFLIEKIGDLFRYKMKLTDRSESWRDICILHGVILLDKYRAAEKGNVLNEFVRAYESPEAHVLSGRRNADQLIAVLEQLKNDLVQETIHVRTGCYAETISRLKTCIAGISE